MDDDSWAVEARQWETIHLDREHEVRFWSDEFGVDAARLEALVGEVGPDLDDIVRALRR